MTSTQQQAAGVRPDIEVQAGGLVRPTWRRLRLWVGLAVLVVLGALLVAALSSTPGRPLDPSSASKDGSKALAVLLRQNGTRVTSSTSVDTAVQRGGTVVVVSPNSYTAAQFDRLATSGARLILLRPGDGVLGRVAPSLRPFDRVSGTTAASCRWPGAAATGQVDMPEGTATYRSAFAASTRQECYGGAVVLEPELAVLGSADLLRNDRLADRGVAALDINVISADRTVHGVLWLMPGTEATGRAAPTVWDLFPAGAHRAFVWLLVLAVLLMLWRGRRFGPVVSEPLPVVVRATEVVEGQGRLYRRAHARDRAAEALRAAAAARLISRLGLQRGSASADVIPSVATSTGRPAGEIAELLTGPPPPDDTALARLAVGLDALEAAAGVPPKPKGPHP